MRLWSKLRNAWGDRRLGIAAGGTAPTDKPGGVYYASVSHQMTREVLRGLELGPDDVFVDIGAGKGRVLALAAQHRVASVTGVEYEPDMVASARANLHRLRGARSPVTVVQGAAEEFDYSDVTVAYCFNAVEADLLGQILAKIEADRASRPFRIAFVEESPAQAEVFARCGWLTLARRFVDREGHGCAIYCTPGAPLTSG